MPILTTAEQLEAVQSAITAVLAGQSWTVDGVTYTRANLADLEARETRLQAKYNREQGNRATVISVRLTGMGYSDGGGS